MFNVLGDCFLGQPVLDLFAGSGALGIEALSRGASNAVFVEQRSAACQVIRVNLRHTRLEKESRIMCMPVERAVPMLDAPFGLVLLDPPYAHPRLHAIMAMVGGARVIGNGTTVVFEHSPRFVVEQRYARLALERQKVYGDTVVSIFVVQEEQMA